GMPSSGQITTSSYVVSLQNGSYAYTVSTQNKNYAPSYISPFTVNGAPVSVPVTFSKVLYKVTFTEVGLPAGSNWSVTLNGTTSSSTSSSISFMEPNGTYSFTLSTTNPAYGPLSTSSFTVSGAVKSVSVTFVALKFTVTFTETGISAGTTWYLNLSDGKSLSSTNSTITVSLVNGTYNYTASSSGYAHKSGSITLNDNSVTV
ncbi:thermopsin precursor, partial [mine drainage metagenome]